MITVENFFKPLKRSMHYILTFLPVVKFKESETVLTTQICDRVPLFKENELLCQVSVAIRKERHLPRKFMTRHLH